ncbi:hypothetical protein M413DRAFT_247783 [Hebeloma cylindrosporum]|uniref:Uncharacterized protein n=1 Tax=Hebeloma cylindrosporum TaxID=76867 RepID=A0A0C2XKB3_HEBCY|nr:hypothetical protein M413DRAFT_247783 [Hebeloma cylindrosporum h7]
MLEGKEVPACQGTCRVSHENSKSSSVRRRICLMIVLGMTNLSEYSVIKYISRRRTCCRASIHPSKTVIFTLRKVRLSHLMSKLKRGRGNLD